MPRRKRLAGARRITISFDERQYEVLRRRAEAKGVSIAEVVRSLVDEYVIWVNELARMGDTKEGDLRRPIIA
jgi:hypothetical protein